MMRLAPGKNVVAYLPWMFRDFAFERALPIVIVGLIAAFPLYGIGRLTDGEGQFLPIVVNQVMSTLFPVAAFLAVYRLVSADRSTGYVRLLFAKPVSVQWFYLQRFLVNGMAFVICMLLFGLVARSVVTIPFSVLLLTSAVMYLSFGGFHFLISVLTRYDVWVSAALWFGAMVVRFKYAGADGIAEWGLTVIPPADVFILRTKLYEGYMVYDTVSTLHLVAYGLVCLVIGLVCLRRRPLAA